MRLLRHVAAGALALAAAHPALPQGQPRRFAAPKYATSAGTDGVWLRGPILGYVFDDSQGQLRPLTGVAGSASLDAPLASVADGGTLTIAPGHEFAIGRQTADSDLALASWNNGQVSWQPLPDAIAKPDVIAFSPTGRSALLYSADSRRLQIWTGLPDAPALLRQSDAPDTNVAAWAVSDDGTAVVASLLGEVPSLQVLGENTRTLASGGAYPAVRFLPGSHDAAYVDSSSNSLTLVQDVTGAASPSTLATDLDGLSDPASLGISGDAAQIVVVNRKSETLTITDLAARTTAKLGYEKTPDELSLLNGSRVFRLNSSVKKGITLLDLSGDAPQLSYVPAPGDNIQ